MSIPAGNGATGAPGTGPALGYLLNLFWFNSLFMLISENNMNTCTYLIHTLSLIYIMKLLVIFGIKIYQKLPNYLTKKIRLERRPFCFFVRSQLGLEVFACHGAKLGAAGYFSPFHIATELLGGKASATSEMLARKLASMCNVSLFFCVLYLYRRRISNICVCSIKTDRVICCEYDGSIS
jgi:hypothetical protein